MILFKIGISRAGRRRVLPLQKLNIIRNPRILTGDAEETRLDVVSGGGGGEKKKPRASFVVLVPCLSGVLGGKKKRRYSETLSGAADTQTNSIHYRAHGLHFPLSFSH